jgi:hypothetical protein
VLSPPPPVGFRPSRSPYRSPSATHSLVEISSADPVVAARAAAILKVHHQYIEKGQRGQSVGPDEERFLEEEERSRRSPFIDFADLPGRSPSIVPIQKDSTPSVPPEEGVARRRLSVWTKADWRRLERALVDLKRELRQKGLVDSEAVVELFIEREGLDVSGLRDEWSR